MSQIDTAERGSRYACIGKERYATLPLARKVARRRNRHQDRAVHPYRCAACEGFHLGGRHP